MLKNTWIVYVTGSLSGYSLPGEFGENEIIHDDISEKKWCVRVKKHGKMWYYKDTERKHDGGTKFNFTLEMEKSWKFCESDANLFSNTLRKKDLEAFPFPVPSDKRGEEV
ncbi:MAG: hypothetical protein ACI4ST_03200 [Candidatus Gallimonas sp.]